MSENLITTNGIIPLDNYLRLVNDDKLKKVLKLFNERILSKKYTGVKIRVNAFFDYFMIGISYDVPADTASGSSTRTIDFCYKDNEFYKLKNKRFKKINILDELKKI